MAASPEGVAEGKSMLGTQVRRRGPQTYGRRPALPPPGPSRVAPPRRAPRPACSHAAGCPITSSTRRGVGVALGPGGCADRVVPGPARAGWAARPGPGGPPDPPPPPPSVSSRDAGEVQMWVQGGGRLPPPPCSSASLAPQLPSFSSLRAGADRRRAVCWLRAAAAATGRTSSGRRGCTPRRPRGGRRATPGPSRPTRFSGAARPGGEPRRAPRSCGPRRRGGR